MTDFERFDKHIRSPCNDLPLPNESCIRLLRRVETPSTGNVRLNIARYDLSVLDMGYAIGCYRALSYTWGPPEALSGDDIVEELQQDTTVDINVCVGDTCYTLAISRNLSNALQKIAPLHQGSLFWVDALCINQRDPKERNVQVQRMGQIYSQAKEVIGWLGEGHSEAEEMVKMHRLFYRRLLTWRRLPQLPRSTNSEPQLDPAQMNVIAAFYSKRRYWKRIWIVQELVLAQRATVAYGHELLYMQSFLTIADLVKNSSSFWSAIRARRDRRTGEHTGNGAELLRISEILRWYRSGRLDRPEFEQMLEELHGKTRSMNPYPCMVWLLSITRIFEATDPRDKVYSMIGLLFKFCGDTADFRADYAKETEDVFYETTVALLKNLPFLSILSQREDRPRFESVKLPSWVPNFASTNVPVELNLQRSLAGGAELFDIWNNIAPSNSVEPLVVNGYQLTVHGVYIASIHRCVVLVSSAANAQTLYNYQQLETVRFLLRACRDIGPRYLSRQPHHSYESTATACADTVTSGQLFLEQAQERARLFSAWISVVNTALSKVWAEYARRPDFTGATIDPQILQRMLSKNKTLPWLSEDMQNVQEEIQRAPDQPRPTLARSGKLVQHMHKHTAARTPFLTEDLMLGMGPRSIQPGDQIWFLHGAKVPFVLRKVPRSTHWRLIGETYLHGAMHGELVNSEKLGNMQRVTII